MTQPAIAITGLGVISATGIGTENLWSALEEGRSGLKELTLFESPRHGHSPVGQVTGDLPALAGPRGSRTDLLAACAALEAFGETALGGLSEAELRNVALVLGTCTGGMLDTERFLIELLREGSFRADLLRPHAACCPTNFVAELLGIGRFRATVSSACASGASAIATACDLLCSGEASIALAGGADSLTRLTVGGFGSLMIVDPKGCRPFDADRAGMSLGEGAAMVAIETAESVARRGVAPLAWITGWGSSCDAYHAAAPAPDGAGMLAAMEVALAQAGVAPREVDYVNAHGTGTIENDSAEAVAIRRCFGDAPPPVSSTKRFFGHMLAAAGAIEVVLCVLALRRRRIPPNLGLQTVDPELGFQPVTSLTPAPLKTVMSNSLGFGGNCCSLVLQRHEGQVMA